ncbi:MAG: molybdopterin-guanine dinucleotide biosynthesis protein B [Candidatus Heimdallarchaeota archaeon]|nr:molybdopterin-guanine dinucleotide biosynthesis protein B [Candidatus Heimdallarchaeota archaeon]
MTATRFIGITGVKKAGKTTTIEALVPKLREKNYRVGTVKVAFKEVSVDVNNEHYDVIRHRKSGPDKTLFKSSIETVYFENEPRTLRRALKQFGQGLDLVLIEAFPKDLIGFPQIALLKEQGQEESVTTDYTVAISSIPEFSIKSKDRRYVPFDELAEVVIKKALPLTPNLNCHHCGYSNCYAFYKEVTAGRREITDCDLYGQEGAFFELTVNGEPVQCKLFVQDVITGVVTAILKTLKIEEKRLKNVELKFSLKQEREDHE